MIEIWWWRWKGVVCWKQRNIFFLLKNHHQPDDDMREWWWKSMIFTHTPLFYSLTHSYIQITRSQNSTTKREEKKQQHQQHICWRRKGKEKSIFLSCFYDFKSFLWYYFCKFNDRSFFSVACVARKLCLLNRIFHRKKNGKNSIIFWDFLTHSLI